MKSSTFRAPTAEELDRLLDGPPDLADLEPSPRLDDRTPARAEVHPWPKLRPLAGPTPPHLDLEKCIPPGLAPFREFCTAVAEALQVPQDAVPPLALALASIGTARVLELTLKPQWTEIAVLWLAVLAEPGERKSALLALLAKPVHEWQAAERANLGHALAAYVERRRSLEARLVGVRVKLQRATGPDVGKLERDALDLARTLANLPELAAPELLTSNATPEAVRDLLTRNGEKVALVSAETDAGQLLGKAYTKSGAPNIDLFLASYTGDPSPSHRVGRDMPLAHPALVMVLCVQPQAVAEVLSDPVARGRGFVDRLCLVQPTSCMGSRRLHPAEVPPELLQWWGDTLRRLLDLPWPGRVILTNDGPMRSEAAPHVMRLTRDAVAIFDALRLDVEKRIGETGDLRPICGFASKLPGVVARIALVLEAMQNPAAKVITAETICAAVEWAPFLIGHFRAVLGDAGESQERRHARRLLAAIVRQGLHEVTARDCFNLIDGAEVPSMAEFQSVLSELIDANYLRPIVESDKQKAPGRPASPRYEVNPAAFLTP